MKVTICVASVFALSLACAPALLAQSASESQVERGRYLVGITGCHDCHSPKLPGAMKPVPERSSPAVHRRRRCRAASRARCTRPKT